MALARNISTRQAETYYEKDDYYTRDRAPSEWHGTGARTLGLEGPVDREVFASLVAGRIPNGPTLHHGGGPRRAGTDFEFSAPKSFSIQALVNGDDRLIDVHQAAVAAARERIEETIATRVTQHGEMRLEFTHCAVIGQFEHATSRAGDPDLHSHVVVLNLTQRADGQWRSVENAEMFKEQRLMYEIYLSELAKGAKDLGYDIAIGKHGNPELAHITREQIEHFSQRSRDLTAALQSQGLTREASTAAQKRAAALSTRDAKKEYDHQALRAEWRERGRTIGLSEYVPHREREPTREYGPTREHGSTRQGDPAEGKPWTSEREQAAARGSVQFAVEHLSEREAVFARRDVLVQALRASRTEAGIRSITTELDRQMKARELLPDTTGQRLTTPAALQAERRLLGIETQGRGAVRAICADADLSQEPAASHLNTGQRSAVELIVTTQNRVVGINGLAGTGKTTALKVARALSEREEFQLIGLAPSHSAVHALTDAGIEARTVQHWLLDRGADAKLGPRTVVLLDEAGLAGTGTLQAVAERIERSGARMVLIGDVHQYESVEAGRGFTQLQKNGMATAQLTEMVRQRDPVLAEAARASVESPARALKLLPIMENENPEIRHQRIAEAFASLSESERRQTLVLTGTHEARRDINERIRLGLKLADTGERIEVFRALDKTIAEKKLVGTYEPGQTIRFEKAYRSLGVQRGEMAQVERIYGNAVVIANTDGTRRTMSPGRLSGKGWSIGTVETIEMAAGDRVRFTGTNPGAGFRNGERGVVEEMRPDNFVVRREDDRTVEVSRHQPASLDYSYAVTGHSAQGLDADRVILEKDTRSLTTSHRSFYTDLTRAKQAAIVATDSAQKLAQMTVGGPRKTAAMDVIGPSTGNAFSHEREP